MCRPKKINDTPLVEKHKLLSSVYTAEFFSGSETAGAAPLKTVTRVFNSSIKDRGAIPNDVSSKALEAFAPEKAKILLNEKEWKCMCCNEGASSFCSSVVGAPSMETVICFTEKIYVVCSDEGCIAKVTQRKNGDSRKHVTSASDFDFRFSFRSALRPIHVFDDGMAKSSPLEMTVVKGTMEKSAEMESVITEENNPLFAMEKEVVKLMVGKESNAKIDSESAMNFVSVNETKKRKLETTTNYPTQELHPNKDIDETRHKRIKKNGDSVSAVQSSVDGNGTFVSKSIQCPTTNDTKKRDEGAKENARVNAAEGNATDPKRAPTKVYLREFPFMFDGEGAWFCRHCLGVPNSQYHYHAGSQPPPNKFIDLHLRLCPVMSQHFPSHD